MTTIIIEASIPYVPPLPEGVRAIRLDNKDFSPERIAEADALVVRSITRCDAELLSGSKIRFIATATAGYDHIDLDYCRRHNIAWANAAGGNARSVAQWVCSALAATGQRLEGATLGIIGWGQVGQAVESLARALGMHILRNDPPLEEAGTAQAEFVPLEVLLRESQFVTLHTPLTREGKYPTLGLVDDAFVGACREGVTLINAARGGIVDTQALTRGKLSGRVGHLLLDCWAGEPLIDAELASLATIATPHIAGFSADGKRETTMRAIRQTLHFLGFDPESVQAEPLPQPEHPIIDSPSLLSSREPALEALRLTLELETLSRQLKKNPIDFARLRKDYRLPREMQAYKIRGIEPDSLLAKQLSRLGFSLI